MSHGWECKYFMSGGGLCTKPWNHDGPHYAGRRIEQKSALSNLLACGADVALTPEVTDAALLATRQQHGGPWHTAEPAPKLTRPKPASADAVTWVHRPGWSPKSCAEWSPLWSSFDAYSAALPRTRRP